MSLRVLSIFAALLLPGALFAQATAPGPADAFQIRYAANLDRGDSVVNITNAGTVDGTDPAGRICVNVYTFRPDQEPINCCTCPVTPNGLRSLSVNRDLNANSVFPQTQNSLVIKLLASLPVGGACNAAAPGALASGMRAWGTTLHVLPGDGVGVTETEFSPATLSAGELNKLTTICSFIQTFATGHGICGACREGGLAVQSADHTLKPSL
jgi:hypothetical protein